MSSIRDVAKIAEVSPATVSRVLNGTAKVDPEKRKRVMAAVQQTGFVPNEVARSLFKKSAKLIGLIVPGVKNPFFTQLAEYMGNVAEKLGYHVFLSVSGYGSENILKTLRMLTSMNVDGVVLAVSNREVEQHLEEIRVPVVAVDCMEKAEHVAASLYCDYYSGGRMAMQHLIDCGCKKVVCIQGEQNYFSAKMRYQGYRDICREQGIEEHVVNCDYDFEAGLAMTEKLLECYPDADGILSCNDVVAASTFKNLHKNHIEVPRQIQLVGFDDIRLARLISPELTTIAQPIYKMAEQAVHCVLQAQNEEFRMKEPVIFPVELVVRETTKAYLARR